MTEAAGDARFLAIARGPSIFPAVHHRGLAFCCTDGFRRQRGRRDADATIRRLRRRSPSRATWRRSTADLDASCQTLRPIGARNGRPARLGRVSHVAWRGSQTTVPPWRVRSSEKNRPARRASKSDEGGSCRSSGPSACPRPAISPRNRLSGSLARVNARSWLISFGILTAKRNETGTLAAQRW